MVRQRRSKGLPLRRSILIVCEDKKSSRLYFSRYASEVRTSVDTPNCTSTDPANLVKFIKNRLTMRDYKLGEIYCVFDAEENSHKRRQQIEKAISESEGEIHFII